ncbi:MAG: hypothetical protein H6Q04_3096 [Acidobacteria bacterium]|nr:hypothetical protein [Acidobacteriota bacterium]
MIFCPVAWIIVPNTVSFGEGPSHMRKTYPKSKAANPK